MKQSGPNLTQTHDGLHSAAQRVRSGTLQKETGFGISVSLTLRDPRTLSIRIQGVVIK